MPGLIFGKHVLLEANQVEDSLKWRWRVTSPRSVYSDLLCLFWRNPGSPHGYQMVISPSQLQSHPLWEKSSNSRSRAPYPIACSIAKLCPTFCDPIDCSTPDFPVFHYLLEIAHIHVHWVSDAIQPSHPLSSLFPPAFNLPQHQGLFQWIGSLHQVAEVLELQLQHLSFQWIFRFNFL